MSDNTQKDTFNVRSAFIIHKIFPNRSWGSKNMKCQNGSFLLQNHTYRVAFVRQSCIVLGNIFVLNN